MLHDADQIEDVISQEEQEALSARTIMCPHGKKTCVRSALFVIAYYHEADQQPCELLDEFSTSVIDIENELIRENIISKERLDNTQVVRVLLTNSLAAREKIYNRLSNSREDTLPNLLEQVITIYVASRLKNQLLQELVSTFGLPVVRNAKILFQLDLSQKLQTKPYYVPMIDLSAKHIRGMAEIKLEAQNKMNRQTLDDILFN